MKQIDLACIIDDDPVYVYGVKRLMKLAGFCKGFLLFSDGREALDSLTPIFKNGKNIPEVILLDINMPIMDGWQFLDEFVKIPSKKKILIYIVSSSIRKEDREKAKSYSKVSDYIIKPITIDNLNTILEELND